MDHNYFLNNGQWQHCETKEQATINNFTKRDHQQHNIMM